MFDFTVMLLTSRNMNIIEPDAIQVEGRVDLSTYANTPKCFF